MPNPINMPTPDTDMSADIAFYWEFYPITTGTNESEIYSDNDRFIINQLVNATTGRTEYVEEIMGVASDNDYTDLINDPDTSYLKMELSQGGRSTRTNFHDSSLVGGFYLQNNKYFEIIGQEGGHIIDVSKKDITQTADLDPKASPDYILPQEFAWKAVEWYMADTRRRFLEGTIVATNISNKRILVDVLSENTATTYGQGYFNLGSREFISFYQRFTEKYSHDINSAPRRIYSKFKGLYTHSTSGGSYAVKNIQIDPARTDGSNYQAIIEFEEEPVDFSVGSPVYTLFDRSPHPRIGSFNGSYQVDVEELPAVPGGVDTNTRICLDGFWLSPRFNIPIPDGTRFGLCGGRYWGLGDRAPDNENAIMFMRTPEGVLGLSSLYHRTSNEDLVLYYDFDSRNLAIRRASLEFSEFPSKYELSIGPPSEVSSASVSPGGTTTVTLDESQDRTKTLTMGIPQGDSPMLFSIGGAENYYGAIISGLGDMNLIAFEESGITQDASMYNFKGQPVSPILEYMFGKYSQTNSRDVHISVPTSESPIIISSPITPVNVPNVQIEYINNNQVINNAQRFDFYEIDDDELMVFMGRKFGSFAVNNPDETGLPISNSSGAGTKWDDSSGIFVIGSKDSGVSWGNPINEFKGDDRFGLLILESVDYCCSIYNDIAEEMVILFIGKNGGDVYLGALILNLINLPYKNFKCTPEGSEQEFLWRPPAIEPPKYKKQVEDGYTFKAEDEGIEDDLIIIASEAPAIEPQIVVNNVTDFGIVSTNTLSDGRMVIFYDSIDGIKMIFSSTSGRKWQGSEILLAHDGKSAVYTNELLIYITTGGIVSKIITETLLTSAFGAGEGSDALFIESIQEEFDNQIITPLDTGEVPTQNLSAHRDDTGIFHVFYYDNNGRLSSAQGTNLGWKTTNNF